jgi:TusA-related sulfurtransferase
MSRPGSSEALRADHILDVKGLFCPIPIARATERMASVSPGEILGVLATDPGVIIDIPAWCHSAGHEFLGYRRDEGVIQCWVRKAGTSVSSAASNG